MISLELYIYVDNIVYGIDLFKDESVSLNSSIQNASDISKTFTDYSQTFTIPASNRNNGIFRHWYENSYENGYDQRLRYNAYIELDTQFFRSGKIQLEKANIKNGVIDSYSITFYGNLTQLKDKFGEDKLNVLDYTSIAHTYSGTEVFTRMTSTASYDVRYPIIGANTRYEYKTGATLYDVTISATTSCIRYNSLFPAVRIAKIMEFIETKYNVDFTGPWLSDPLYTNLYLYGKNAEILKPFGAETKITSYATSSYTVPNAEYTISSTYSTVRFETLYYTVYNSDTNLRGGNYTTNTSLAAATGFTVPPLSTTSFRAVVGTVQLGAFVSIVSAVSSIFYDYDYNQLIDVFNLTRGELTTPSYMEFDYTKPAEYQTVKFLDYFIYSTSNIPYIVRVYKNGILFSTSTEKINNSSATFNAINVGGIPNLSDTYYITISSTGPMTYTAKMRTIYNYYEYVEQPDFSYAWVFGYSIYDASTGTQTTSGLIDVKNYVPDMKVADFFTGLVKMFNLIVDPVDERTFNLLSLETFYTTGIIKDLTKYVITDTMTLDRAKLYKKINFTYEESKNILNYSFNTTTAQVRGYNYGNLSFEDQYTNDSQSYEVKVGFEDVMWERASSATQSYNFMSATMWDKDLKPYLPKPMLFYYNGLETLGTGTTNTLKIALSANGTGITQSSNYIRFSNEYNLLGNTSSDISQVHSLNWGDEISSWYLSNVSNSLYNDNYSNYINNIYDIKTRLFKVKMILPTTVLADIKLNDRIIIRDKRYLINNMNTNLTTGVVDFDLVTDSRIIT